MKSLRRVTANARWVAAFAIALAVSSVAPVLADSPPEIPPPTTLSPANTGPDAVQLPTNQDMADTLGAFEAEEEEKLETLRSPAAIREREASRAQYKSLTASQAEQLLSTQFAPLLEALDAEPARFLSTSQLIRPLGRGGALVVSEGHKELIEGTAPVRIPDAEGQPSKIDLTLESTGSGYEAVNPLVDIDIPTSPSEGVELGEEGLGVSQSGAREEISARSFGEMSVFYPEVQTDTDLLVSPIATGVEFFDQLRSEESPETLRFDVQLPEGARLRSIANAAEVVATDGSRLADIPPPTAVDAQGTEVPVEIQTDAETLVLKVPHNEGNFAYPILVDPIIQEWYWQNWYEGYNLQALSNGAWHWNTSEGSGSSYVYGSTSCIYSCWGSGRGLYMDTPNGNLPANRWGQWSYSAPNSETYLANAWVSPFWRDNHVNCSQSKYGQPYDYDGMWNESSWNRILYNQANDQGWSDIESWGRAFIIGMGTSSGISIPCWRDVMAGGTRIWLEDWSRPYLTTTPTYQWMDNSKIRLNVSAYDSGLGVQKFKATATNKSGQTEEWWTGSSCTGLYEAPCPHTWNLAEGSQPELNFSPANLPEGIDKLSVTAYDAVEKPSFTTNEMDIEVDHGAPTITLSGTLTEQAKLGPELPSYTVRADASDGVPKSKNPADARSGVTTISFEVDGKLVHEPYSPGCSTQSCAWYQELEVPAHEMTSGSHTLRVKAIDKLGHVGTKELSFTTGDTRAPTLSVTGGPNESSAVPVFISAFGSPGTGNGQFDHPGDVAVNAQGTLWVVDAHGDRIEKFNEAGQYLSSFGSLGTGNGQLYRPTSLALDAKGNIWVADSGNSRLQEFNEKGEFIKTVGTQGSGNGQFLGPEGIAIDPKGNIWVADTYNGRLQEFNEKGEFLKVVGTKGSGPGQLIEPTGIDVGPGGNVWVTDWFNQRVEVYNEAGEYVRQFGSKGSGNGQFIWPDAIEVDSRGNVWVADQDNSRVQEFNQNGEYVAQFGSKGSGDGQFNFGYPMGIASDAKGNLWVSDSFNNRVQRWRVPITNAGRFIDPISVTANDGGFGVTSITMKLTNEVNEPEVLDERTQACPKGACSLTEDFDGLDLSERPPGPYTLSLIATDGAGHESTDSRVIGLDPSPPIIALSGILAERAGLPLNASSGELTIKATDTSLTDSGVKEIYVEREGQRVAAFPSNCASGCQEVSASYRYSAARDGAERSVQPAAKPTGSTSTSLSGVSCASASDCMGVGYYKNSEGTILTLVEHWNGSAWQVLSSPNPGGALESRLEGVSCISASNCTAVGYYKTGSEAFSTLIERWNGSSWSIATSPNPGGMPRAYLYGVSCGSANDCWAVGKSAHTVSEEAEWKTPTALLEHWNGSAWSISAFPEAPGQLVRVSCVSATSCVAVSGQKDSSIARWNGSNWVLQTAATPTGGSGVAFKDISCSSENACTVVGSYLVSGHGAPLAETWNGSTWAVQATPSPVGMVDEVVSGVLEAVSCSSASACTSTGTRSTFDETLPLVEGWDGTEWSVQPAAIPSGTKTAIPRGIACSGGFNCTAVGSYGDSSTQALIESEAAGKGQQAVTVEAVDKYGSAESKSIVVDAPEEKQETPTCNQKVTSLTPEGVLSPAEAISAAEKSLPTALAGSKATTDPNSDEQVDPSYSTPKPNLENVGTLAEGETAATPEGGFTLSGLACVTPATTTSAATEAKVVNSDVALFANTAPQTDTVIRPSAAGTTVVQLLRGSNAPTTVSWHVHVNAGESIVKLPSGVLAVTQPSEGETEGTAELAKPSGIQTRESLNDAAIQLEVGAYRLAEAQAETTDEVVAVIAQPWVVLKQGGIVPVKIELTTTAVPTEYNVTYTLPPFEPNFTPEAVVTEASASSIVNARCYGGSPCGNLNINRAVQYAEHFGDPHHPRNSYYHDYGDDNCTNFISQILARGEMSFMRAFHHGEGSWWYFNTGLSWPFPDHEDTESWRLADILPRHLWQYGLANIDSSNQPSGWTAGDIIAEDWYATNGKGDFNHLQFVVGTFTPAGHDREPLLANESSPGSNYSHLRWSEVKVRIEQAQGSEWNRVPLAVKHTIAELDAKKHDPDNLYGPSGVFNG